MLHQMYKNHLKEIREFWKLTTSSFAERYGYNQPTYYRYEKGTNQIPDRLIQNLALEGVNLHYLFTGEGPMFLPQKSEKQQKYEQAFKERKTFGKRLNYYQAEENLMDDEIAKIIDTSESRVEELGLDKSEPTLAELRALKSYSGIPIDLWVDGELTGDSGTVTQMLPPEEQKMLEFLKKAKENKLI